MMIDRKGRSEQVIAAYRRHKISVSALSQIRHLLLQFEREREFDRRAARYGVGIIVAILALAALSLITTEQISLF